MVHAKRTPVRAAVAIRPSVARASSIDGLHRTAKPLAASQKSSNDRRKPAIAVSVGDVLGCIGGCAGPGIRNTLPGWLCSHWTDPTRISPSHTAQS
jgi:hypothetical protein